MKATIATAAAAALVGTANAGDIHRRHAHGLYHDLQKKADNSTCGCTTIYSTYYGEATLYNPPAPTPTSTAVVVVVPTPAPQTVDSTGVYTFPATTITVSETTTVCGASTTGVPPGEHTLGGVTTVVTTETTVTCPYATTEVTGDVTTSVIKMTEYYCPASGTYTIAPHTTSVDKSTTIAVPVVQTFEPGTYTQDEIVTTITETSTTIYCPFTSQGAEPTTTPTPEFKAAAIVTPTEVPTPIASSSSVVKSSATSSAATPSKTASVPAGKPWGITYTPYTESGECKSKSQVASDIASIAAGGVNMVRVYSTDCDTLPNVGSAVEANGMKIMLGIFINGPGCTASNPPVQQQIAAIKAWGKFDLVESIIVGNEAQFNGYCTASEIAGLISTARSAFTGYSGPFSTTETVNVWQETAVSSVLCDVVDFVACNSHAYFNQQTVASQAGEFVKGQLEIISNICPGKSGKVVETGWPTEGNTLGKAVAGVSEQLEAIKSLIAEVGQDAVILGFSNDSWKGESAACGVCEMFWGAISALGIA